MAKAEVWRQMMKIKNNTDVQEVFLEEEGIQNVSRKILIGPEDGSSNIIMRYFKVFPGGNTPFHSHRFEHVIKIEKGRGLIVNETGEEIPVFQGQSVFIAEDERHQFKNPHKESFEFSCIILNPEKIQ